ncbi:MAG: efflux RND transporter periplasmic adaptor subunit [Planctomycetota bacterium]|nr:efflux RND transporter periplasmic adaptor subunit [Planctomycetota bacterium]
MAVEKRLAISVGSAGLLVGLLLLAVRAAEEKADNTPAAAKQEAAGESLPAVFEPRRRAVLSARISSQVVRIHKEMGEAFGADEVLLTFDDTVFRAAQQRAAAQYRLALATLKNRERLSQDGGISQIELEQARTEAEVAAANLRIAEKELAQCVVRAPWPGRVAEIMVNEHEIVALGKPLMEIVDDRVLLAKALAPASWLPRLRLGQTVGIRVIETGETVDSRLSHIGAVVEPASATVRIYVEVDNSAGRIRPGMRGEAIFPLPAEKR